MNERKASVCISGAVIPSRMYSISTGQVISLKLKLARGFTRTRANNHTSTSIIVIESIFLTPVSHSCRVINGLVLFPVVVPIVCEVRIDPLAGAVVDICIGVILPDTPS